MADLYGNTSSSPAPPPEPNPPATGPDSDEMSVLLHQILRRSSSASSSSTSVREMHKFSSSHALDDHRRRSGSVFGGVHCPVNVDADLDVDGANIGSMESNLYPRFSHLSDFWQGNDLDEFDCESEEGLEEMPAKPVLFRGSLKRSRAAEVHNLSEKRRRSRINEKMKALQNLIPNANKTDKASMLDEAIEYLKQLQLQVQMLSMRNGFSLHPMCLPGAVPPIQISQTIRGFDEGNDPPHTLDQQSRMPNVLSLSSQCTPPTVTTVANIIYPSVQASSGLEAFRFYKPEQICREDGRQCQPVEVNHSQMNPLGSTATLSFPFKMQASGTKDSGHLEAHILGGDRKQEHNQILFQHSNRMQARSVMKDKLPLPVVDF